MIRRASMVLAGLLLLSSAAGAQAVPEGSQARRVDPGYRRTPSLRIDPFRHVMIPHFGLVISGGALAENNAFNLADIGSIRKLSDADSLTLGDAFDALGLIPGGAGWSGLVQGEAGLYLGGALGSHLGIGVSAATRGYGVFEIDDNAVALLRDGNQDTTMFSLGNSRASTLVTGEFGVHAVVRLDALGSSNGVSLTLGAGVRILRPIAYVDGRSTIQDGGTISITDTLVTARIGIQGLNQNTPGTVSEFFNRRSGMAADFLVRLEWPTNGFAFEVMAANIGTVDVEGVERRDANIDVTEATLGGVVDVLTFKDSVTGQDTLSFSVRDTLPVVNVTLPKVIRVSTSAWANRILQIDLAATAPVTGDFDTPLIIDVGTTWRLLRIFPIRVGLVVGGPQGIGYTGGIAIEGRRFYFQAAGATLGGLFRNATGSGGRFDLGLFF